MEKPVWINGSPDLTFFDLRRTQSEMLEQDNRCTSYPLFEVRENEIIEGVDPDFNGKAELVAIIWDADGERVGSLLLSDKTLGAQLEAVIADLESNTDLERDCFSVDGEVFSMEGFQRQVESSAFRDQIDLCNEEQDALLEIKITGQITFPRTVATCFTKREADNYIARNKCYLNAPHVYVSSAYDNPELKCVMEFLALGDMHSLRSRQSTMETTPNQEAEPSAPAF